MKLTKDQIDQYHTQGYLHLEAVYTKEDIERCRAIIEEDQRNGGWEAAPHSNTDLTTDIYERLPELTEIVFNHNYIEIVKQLFGPEPVIIAEPVVHKSRYYYWHKDSTFITEQGEDYHLRKDFSAAMTVMYLQENHPEYGGGITLIPNTQWTTDFVSTIPHMSKVERGILKLQKLLGMSQFDKLDKHPDLTPIPTKVGDVLFLDMRLDHKGTPAKKASPVTKYGIMNIACRSNTVATKLQNTLRNRPSAYYQEYLRNEPLSTPTLEAIGDKADIKIIV